LFLLDGIFAFSLSPFEAEYGSILQILPGQQERQGLQPIPPIALDCTCVLTFQRLLMFIFALTLPSACVD
jgi:hypothetical protein